MSTNSFPILLPTHSCHLRSPLGGERRPIHRILLGRFCRALRKPRPADFWEVIACVRRLWIMVESTGATGEDESPLSGQRCLIPVFRSQSPFYSAESTSIWRFHPRARLEVLIQWSGYADLSRSQSHDTVCETQIFIASDSRKPTRSYAFPDSSRNMY